MGRKLAIIVALSTALAPLMANAIGLGEISLQSRIGEPLVAEIPILSSSHEPPVAACFSLLALRGLEFPVVTAGKPRLLRRGESYFLQIVGHQAINEPVFVIGVRAGCGYDVERQYVLMPEPPMALPQATVAADSPPPPRKTGRYTRRPALEGETLESIADAQTPASPAERERLLAALKRANPDLEADAPLAEGTVLHIPRPRRTPSQQTTANTPEAQASRGEALAAIAPAPMRKPKPAPANTLPAGTDRLVLGSAEAEPASSRGNSALASVTATEERLLKLETTLHQLTREVEKMEVALDLATKTIEAQNRLQLAQTVSAPPANGPAISTTSAPANLPSQSNWLELMLSAAVGASLSVGMAQYLSRRRRYPGEEEAPLAFTAQRASIPPKNVSPVMPDPVVATATESPREKPPAATEVPEEIVPLLPECDVPLQPEPDVIEANGDDDYSVLALAEIMLSFGRLRGAAETLAEHIDENLPKSIEPWSMLLDLYRRGGMRDEFEVLATKMRSLFNAEIPAWNDSTTPISGLKTLEDFPHVIQKASRLWGTQESVDYLFSLVHDIRTGQRNGFPLEVVEEIALLMRIQVEAYGLKQRN